MVIDLGYGVPIPILYEDRSVMAVDKPRGWMLAPDSWRDTDRNLHLALVSSISEGAYWARSRNLKYLRYIHRLDAETSGVLLLAKSPGALETLSALFEKRAITKIYLAVVRGEARQAEWTCEVALTPPEARGARVTVDEREGKPAETSFRVLAVSNSLKEGPLTLIEARPATGRTHQIRVHLAHAGLPVMGDAIYGPKPPGAVGAAGRPLGLRATRLSYPDPFDRRQVKIGASFKEFLKEFGFGWLNGSEPAASPAFREFVAEHSPRKPFPPRPAEPPKDSKPVKK